MLLRRELWRQGSHRVGAEWTVSDSARFSNDVGAELRREMGRQGGEGSRAGRLIRNPACEGEGPGTKLQRKMGRQDREGSSSGRLVCDAACGRKGGDAEYRGEMAGHISERFGALLQREMRCDRSKTLDAAKIPVRDAAPSGENLSANPWALLRREMGH